MDRGCYDSTGTAPHTGTTIVAVSFDGGVVVGADSRVSTGNYISNRASDKLTPLAENVWLMRSGSAADTQAISDYVRHFVENLTAELGRNPTVHTVAQLVKTINYQNKQLIGAMLVGGWDEIHGGQVYGIPIGGTLSKEKWSTDGSGSTYIWGYLDSAYRDNMTQEEAEEVVANALALAMSTDGSSGGLIRLVTVTKDGSKRKMIKGNEVAQYGEELQPAGATGMVIG
eukprot:jgi/Botrbrau1/14767/Bobra.0284s0001.1